jgi:nucleoside-diphosphate-sugar epimerase
VHKIAVTGGTGFIGSALISTLIEQGGSVRLLSRAPSTAQRAPSISVVTGDLDDPTALSALVRDMHCVIHLAGYAHATSKPIPAEIARHRRINLEGTQNLFRCVAAAGVRRFVFVSSVKAGGEAAHDCLNERSARRPIDPYGLIKRETEEWLFEQGVRSGVEISVLRPALVYGPGVKGNLAALLRAIDRRRFPPVAETHNIRSMVSVQDVVAALLAATVRPEAAGRVCILEDGEAYSTRRIYTAMATALGKSIPVWSLPASVLRGLGRVGDFGETVLRRSLPFNSTLAVRLLDSACYRSIHADAVLGVKPQNRLEDILPAMVRAYRKVS